MNKDNPVTCNTYIIQNLLLTSAVKVVVHCSVCPCFRSDPAGLCYTFYVQK